jgi:hypothetical protein
MCRYGDVRYKDHYACFSCRKMFRQVAPYKMAHPPADGEVPIRPCPQCGSAMANLGLDFKAPRQTDVKQWRKVQRLFAAGYDFHSCGCCGPGPRPATLHEVGPFIAEQEREQAQWKRQVLIAARSAERDKRRKVSRLRPANQKRKPSLAIA